uniref:PABPN1 like, cytoplasmic n=1 Tax=Loxodonta africana TaxID=9785 RepID=G3U9A0_LOXAF
MWPFPSSSLFPPPTEAWLQRATSDPEAQGWGAWSGTGKPPLGPGHGEKKEEEKKEDAKKEDEEDASFPLSILERENLAECPAPDQELEAIRLKLWAMEQAGEPPGLPNIQGVVPGEEGTGIMLAGGLLSPETGLPFPESPQEKEEVDHRSIYVGNLCLHRVGWRGLRAGRTPHPAPPPALQSLLASSAPPSNLAALPPGLARTPRLRQSCCP